MYLIHWDSEDYRFDYYDESYWHNIEDAKKAIREKCIENKAKILNDELEEEGNNEMNMKGRGDGDFLTWVNWCIDNFLYIEEIKFMG